MSRAFNLKQINKGIFPELVLCGCSAVSFSYFFKNVFCLNYYKDYTTLNQNDGPVQPSERLKSIYSAVEQDVKGYASEHTPTVPYIVPGLKVLHAGTVGTFQGGVIGLPLYFEYNDKADVEDKVKRADSLTSEEPEEELYDCFLLSDKAKKYAIARGILCVNTLQVYVETVIPFGVACFVKLICTYAPSLFNIHTNLISKGLFYALLLVSGLSIWRRTHSLAKNYFEGNVEEMLVSLGLEYIEGAIEFYSKALEREQRKLDWKDHQDSSVLMTIRNKIDPIISRKDIPLNYRLAFYKSKLDALKNNNKKEEEVELIDE